MRLFVRLFSLFFLVVSVFPVAANEVEILDVHFIKRGKDVWTVRTQVRHEDTGWEHYADGWRIVDEQGNELGKRVLFHPHETEQPFTRSLNDVNIPRKTTVVYVEARDNVHGWAKNRVKVYLNRASGPGYRVTR